MISAARVTLAACKTLMKVSRPAPSKCSAGDSIHDPLTPPSCVFAPYEEVGGRFGVCLVHVTGRWQLN